MTRRYSFLKKSEVFQAPVWPFALPVKVRQPFVIRKKLFTAERCSQLVSLVKRRYHASRVRNAWHRLELYNLTPEDSPTWLYPLLEEVLQEAGMRCWGLGLSGMYQAVRVQCYRPGDFFTVHSDYEATDNTKVGLSAILTDGFEGGEFHVEAPPPGHKTGAPLRHPKLKQGDGVLFPGWVPHSVLPVTSGERWALLAWAQGGAFT